MPEPIDPDDPSIPLLTDIIAEPSNPPPPGLPLHPARARPGGAKRPEPFAKRATPMAADSYVQPSAYTPAPPVQGADWSPAVFTRVANLAEGPPGSAPVDEAELFYPHDADALSAHLRERLALYLSGEGGALIESRCRDAMSDHASWLIHQVTREVALAVESQLSEWIGQALHDQASRLRKYC